MTTDRRFSRREVAAALGTSVQQVRAWHELVRLESAEDGYTFRELVAFRALHALKSAGLSRARLLAALRHLRLSLPAVDVPLRSVRLRVEGREVIVDLEDRSMTASGQLLLDLDGERPTTTVVSLPGATDRAADGRALAADLARAHTELGRQLLAAGHTLAARDELERALAFEPDHAEALAALAAVFTALGCTTKAAEIRRLAAASSPDGRRPARG